MAEEVRFLRLLAAAPPAPPSAEPIIAPVLPPISLPIAVPATLPSALAAATRVVLSAYACAVKIDAVAKVAVINKVFKWVMFITPCSINRTRMF